MAPVPEVKLISWLKECTAWQSVQGFSSRLPSEENNNNKRYPVPEEGVSGVAAQPNLIFMAAHSAAEICLLLLWHIFVHQLCP